MISTIAVSTFSELRSLVQANNHDLTLVSVEKSLTSWGVSGRAVRQRQRMRIWFDAADNSDRIVVVADVILNAKNTVPEKRCDLNFEISHYSEYDSEKRRFTMTHPERYARIDGQETPDGCKSLWAELAALPESMERSAEMSFTGCDFFKKAC